MASDRSWGHLSDWITQLWVRLTGRRLSLAQHAWLDGPAGTSAGIGRSFFETYASEHALRVCRGESSGLVPSLETLRGPAFDPAAVAPAVAHFYTHTSSYELDAWSQWTGIFRPFGWLFAVLFSRRLQQLNVPLSNLDTCRGMTSDVAPIVDPETDDLVFTAWVRQLAGTGSIIYAGAYSTCIVPRDATPCVRVVFPLPNGNAMVLMRPVAHSDGSLSLISAGEEFGSPGFYFTLGYREGVVRARYVRALRETIHVYPLDGNVCADHDLTLWGSTFLRLHYRMRRQS